MADKKISELTAQTGAGLATDDLFVTVDKSTSGTKKITLAELLSGVLLDEDNMVSDSATYGVTQQSAKAYVDNSIAALSVGGWELWETTYDHGVTGDVATAESGAFADGYEYAFRLEGLRCSSTGRPLCVAIYKATDAAWHSAINISTTNNATFDDYWGWVETIMARTSASYHQIRASVHEDVNITAGTDDVSGGFNAAAVTAGMVFWSLATAQKVGRVRFSWVSGNITGGKIIGYRRAI